MKKILAISILGLFLAGMIIPVVAGAWGIPDSCAVTHVIYRRGNPSPGVCPNPSSAATQPECCITELIYNITDWLFYILISMVVLLVIIGGSYYVTSGGDPEKADKGREIIIYALIGLVIAVFAKVIPGLAKIILGVS